jgi:hypothetical protein
MISMRAPCLFAVLGLLAACGSGGTAREVLGLDKSAPDEFRVVTRPPLSVPPQFNLRPPSATDQGPGFVATDEQARAAILGTTPASKEESNVFSLREGSAPTAVTPVDARPLGIEAGSSADAQLLKNAGAENADPSVRDKLIEEKIVRQQTQEEQSWWESMSVLPEKKEPVVDAKGERERIQTNQRDGKPVTEGETPAAKSTDRGMLGRILGDW